LVPWHSPVRTRQTSGRRKRSLNELLNRPAQPDHAGQIPALPRTRIP